MSRRDASDLLGSVALGAWAAFGVLAMAVFGQGRGPLWLDEGFLFKSVGHRQDLLTTVARGITATGTGVIPYLLAVLAGVIAGRTARQRVLTAGLALACLGAGQAVRYALMDRIQRPRPPLGDWATHASGWSFPSGHSSTAAITAGLLVAALWVRAPRGHTALRAAVALWGALVGLTRVFLGVHWFTDVLGGWLFAAGWLGTCLGLAVRFLPSLRTPPTTAPGPMETHAPQDPGGGGRSRPA
jgi:undecaprenyl-diphosphatase